MRTCKVGRRFLPRGFIGGLGSGLLVIALSATIGGEGWAQTTAGAKAPAVGAPVPAATPATRRPAPGVRNLTWEEMIPPNWNPRQKIDKLNLKGMSDNDPRANELLASLRAEWDRAPVVKALAGQKVRLPGYIVSLEGDAKGVREFLLVPYFGACIHVPPPPANQVVHVFPERLVPDGMVLMPVWVSGVIEIESVDTALGSAGYQIRQATVEEYVASAKN